MIRRTSAVSMIQKILQYYILPLLLIAALLLGCGYTDCTEESDERATCITLLSVAALSRYPTSSSTDAEIALSFQTSASIILLAPFICEEQVAEVCR